MSKRAKFELNEKVWACDKGTFYPAKILRRDSLSIVHKYFVHYPAWPPAEDVWLDEKLIEPWNNGQPPLKTTVGERSQKKNKRGGKASSSSSTDVNDTEEEKPHDVSIDIAEEKEESASQVPATRGLRKRKEVDTTADEASVVDNAPATTTAQSYKSGYKKITRTITQTDLFEDPEETTFYIKFNIPNDLKRHMVDEWIIITQEKPSRLLKLPKRADRTVQALLQHYFEDKKLKVDAAELRNVKELVSSLTDFFNKALPTVLLYRQERAQYDAVVQMFPQVPASELYGGEHLLRLYVRFPRYLSQILGVAPQVQVLQSHLIDLLKFLAKNASQYVNIHNYVSYDEAMDVKEAEAPEAESSSAPVKRRGRPAHGGKSSSSGGKAAVASPPPRGRPGRPKKRFED